MNFELIVKEGKTFALVPVSEYGQVLAAMEMQDDVRTLQTAKSRLNEGGDEIIPFSIITRRLSGENTVKIWREHRSMTQEQLSDKSGVSRSLIAAIESGHKTGSIASVKKLAGALNCDVNNLI